MAIKFTMLDEDRAWVEISGDENEFLRDVAKFKRTVRAEDRRYDDYKGAWYLKNARSYDTEFPRLLNAIRDYDMQLRFSL